ncbi:ASNSD1 upstream open reading frame protein-like [Ostrea edulis]|uniref:ASNSD1 upstream open reading frame protein-like n=1 Tax=Ostrea edulis TaxID=37623 RepID=UPI0020961B3F|nr:ASNSD1 upstream open reading frame protein-like [Ostrea edulis]
MENRNLKFQEQKILETELTSLKKGARVYQQQQNSNVFFLSKREDILKESKQTLENLCKEYKSLEKSEEESTSNVESEIGTESTSNIEPEMDKGN